MHAGEAGKNSKIIPQKRVREDNDEGRNYDDTTIKDKVLTDFSKEDIALKINKNEMSEKLITLGSKVTSLSPEEWAKKVRAMTIGFAENKEYQKKIPGLIAFLENDDVSSLIIGKLMKTNILSHLDKLPDFSHLVEHFSYSEKVHGRDGKSYPYNELLCADLEKHDKKYCEERLKSLDDGIKPSTAIALRLHTVTPRPRYSGEDLSSGEEDSEAICYDINNPKGREISDPPKLPNRIKSDVKNRVPLFVEYPFSASMENNFEPMSIWSQKISIEELIVDKRQGGCFLIGSVPRVDTQSAHEDWNIAQKIKIFTTELSDNQKNSMKEAFASVKLYDCNVKWERSLDQTERKTTLSIYNNNSDKVMVYNAQNPNGSNTGVNGVALPFVYPKHIRTQINPNDSKKIITWKKNENMYALSSYYGKILDVIDDANEGAMYLRMQKQGSNPWLMCLLSPPDDIRSTILEGVRLPPAEQPFSVIQTEPLFVKNAGSDDVLCYNSTSEVPVASQPVCDFSREKLQSYFPDGKGVVIVEKKMLLGENNSRRIETFYSPTGRIQHTGEIDWLIDDKISDTVSFAQRIKGGDQPLTREYLVGRKTFDEGLLDQFKKSAQSSSNGVGASISWAFKDGSLSSQSREDDCVSRYIR